MKKLKLTLTSTVLLIVILCTGCKSIDSGFSLAAMQANLNIEEDKHVKSILDEEIKNTLVSNGNSLCAEDNSEVVELNLATFDGIYFPYCSGISCFPFSLAQRNPRAFDLAGIVNETTIYTIQRRNDENIGDYFVYNFYAADENVVPFKDGDDISLAVYKVNEKAKQQDPVDTVDEPTWNWYLAGLEIRVSKRLSAKDFDGISIGSTIEEVTSVDPVTAMSLPNENSLTYNPLEFDTFHYTDDGILRITFAREAVEEEFLVSEIELNKTFEVGFDGSPAVDEKPTVKLKINPEHLPD